MQCWRCRECDTRLCPFGPLRHIRITIDATYPDPNIKPEQGGDSPTRLLFAGDIVAYDADFARWLVQAGLAEFYEVAYGRTA